MEGEALADAFSMSRAKKKKTRPLLPRL